LLLTAYAVVVLGTWLLSVARTETTLVTGWALLRLSGAFLLAELVRVVRAGDDWLSLSLVAFALLTAASLPVRDIWVLGRFDEASVRALIEQSLKQLRIGFAPEGTSYRIFDKADSGTITLRASWGGRAVMRIRCDGRSRKIELLRALLRKRFGRLLPRPHIRFGR
jgi:hypothetical protein